MKIILTLEVPDDEFGKDGNPTVEEVISQFEELKKSMREEAPNGTKLALNVEL